MSVVEVGSRTVVEAPAVVPATVRERLHRAADLIEEFGWTQHDCGAKNRGFCLMGAFFEANADYGLDYREGMEDAGALVWKGLPHRTGQTWPIDWNNDPGRTKAEVVAKLREAAEAAEAS